MVFSQERSDYMVAAVCGNEVRVFDVTIGARRPLREVMQFQHYGAALSWAIEFDEKQRKK